jgi:hypothetical protein
MSWLWWMTTLGMPRSSFLKGETFRFVPDLLLRLKNERHEDAIRVIRSDTGSEFKNSRFKTFCHDLGLEH